MLIRVIPNPLDRNEDRLIDVDYKYQSIGDLFDSLDWGDRTDFIPVVSGGKVEWDHIHSIDDELIFIADLQGKGGGLIAGIALVGLSFLFPPGGMMAAAAMSAGAGMIVGGIAGFFAPSVDVPQPAAESQTYSWNGIQNIIGEGSTLPIVVGQHRIGGAVIEAFISGDTDTGIQENKYLNVLMALSEGEIEDIDFDQIYVNKKEISLYGEITHDHRLGTEDQKPMPEFSKIVRHHVISGATLKHASPYIYKTNDEVDEVTLTLMFPGLYHMNGEGVMKEQSCSFKVEFAEYRAGIPTDYTLGGTFTVRDKSRSKAEYSYKVKFPQRDRYLIKVTRTTGDFTDTKDAGDSFFQSVSEAECSLLSYPHTALLGLRIKATDNISGGMPTITAYIKGKKFRDVRWLEFSPKWTDNPANILYGMLLDKRYGLGRWITEDNFDLESFKELADWCDEMVPYKYYEGATGEWIEKFEKRYAFNCVFDTPVKANEFINMLCGACRSIPYWSGDKLKIAIERPSDPVQLFSMGNIIEDSFEESYFGLIDIPNQVEATFYDEEDDYNRASIVCVDKKRLKEPTFSRQLQIKGLTSKSRVKREMIFALKKARSIGASITFQAGIDAIIVEAGDVFLFQHHTPQYGLAGGRIREVRQSSVILSHPAEVVQGKQYSLRVRKRDNSFVVYTLVAEMTGETNEIKLDKTPDCAVGDIFSFGEVHKEAKPYRVTSISKKTDLTVEISGEEYNESVFEDDGSIEVEDIQYSTLGLTERYELDGTADEPVPIKKADNPAVQVSYYDQPPYVLDVGLTEGVEVVNNQIQTNITIDFQTVQMPENSLAKIIYYDILHSTDGTHWDSTKAVGEMHTLRNVEVGVKHYILVKPYTQYGVTNDIENSEHRLSWDINTVGVAPVPDNVRNFFAVQNGAYINFSWVPVTNSVIEEYEIRVGEWESGQRVGTTKNFGMTGAVKGTGPTKFQIKAKSVSGGWSYLPSEMTIDLVLPQSKNVVLKQDEKADGWNGTSHGFEIAPDNTLRLKSGVSSGTYVFKQLDLARLTRSRNLVDFRVSSVNSNKLQWEDTLDAWDSQFAAGVWELPANIDNLVYSHDISIFKSLPAKHIDIIRLNDSVNTEKGGSPTVSTGVVYGGGTNHRGVKQSFKTQLEYDLTLPGNHSILLRHRLPEVVESGVVFTLFDGTKRIQIVIYPFGHCWLWDGVSFIQATLPEFNPNDNLLFGVGTADEGKLLFYAANTTQKVSGKNTGLLNFGKPTKLIIGS